MNHNPFRPTRFERHQRPLIWVSQVSRRILNDEGAFYVAGARGSGKTSILKSLDTAEQIVNPTLASQLTLANMACLGVYFRATDLFTQTTAGVDWRR
jgi:predicted ATPase